MLFTIPDSVSGVWLLMGLLGVPVFGFWTLFAQYVLAPLITTGFGLWGASKASGAVKSAAEIQRQTADAALKFERERDTYEREQYLEERDRDRELQNYYLALERQRQGRLAPYRATGQSAGNTLAGLLGLDSSGVNFQPPPLPPGFALEGADGAGGGAGTVVNLPSAGVQSNAPGTAAPTYEPAIGERFQPNALRDFLLPPTVRTQPLRRAPAFATR